MSVSEGVVSCQMGAPLNLGVTGNLHNEREWQPAKVLRVDGVKRAEPRQAEQSRA